MITTQAPITRDTIGHARELVTEVEPKEAGRGFTGIGVPYGETIDLWGMKERFEPGSVELDMQGVPSLVLWQHDTKAPIGRITDGKDTDQGFEITATLSQTDRGQEAAMLLDEGIITRLSIGFEPLEWRIEHNATTDEETIVHTKVRALEFSLVSFPAYPSAEITTVRNRKEPTMTTTIENELASLATELTDMKRELASISTTTQAAPAAPYFRSMGDYLTKVASGDERAIEFHERATTEDTGLKNETHLGNFVKWVQARRTLINLFDTGTLPAKGMTVTYTQLKADNTKAGEQTKENTNLAGPGEIVFQDQSANVRTFGGYAQISRQVIDRVEVPYLDSVMTALGIKYAHATNDALRKEITAIITEQAEGENSIKLPANARVFDYRDAIVDAKAIFDENGFTIDGLLVSKDDFKALQRLTYAELPALKVHPQDEFSGTLNLPTAEGSLANIPVHTVFGGYTGPAAFYDSSAVKSLESPNAPVRLQDDNIINLSRAFSLYGYLAFIAPFPQAIVPLTITSGKGNGDSDNQTDTPQ